jgi:hypothetical protein
MPSKAGMWRQGPSAETHVSPGGGGLGFRGGGNAMLRKRNEMRPGIFAFVCKITRIPQTRSKGNATHGYYSHFSVGGVSNGRVSVSPTATGR